MGQNNNQMRKTVSIYGVTCIKLNEGGTKNIISQKEGVFIHDLSIKYLNSNEYEYKIFMLSDSSYLYQYVMGGYLLANLSQLNVFLNEKANEKLRYEKKFKRFNADFILKTDSLISAFANSYRVQLNFLAMNDLKKIDDMINKDVFSLDDYYCTIVAVVGKYFTSNIENAIWINQMWPKGIIPVVQNSKTLFSPVDIVEETLIRIRKNKPSSLYLLTKRSFDKGNY
jgi:hypothetical protein